MRIGIDARFALGQLRGIGNYSLQLIRALAAIDLVNEYILYTDRHDHDAVLPPAPNFRVRRLIPRLYPLWEQLALPFAACRDQLDILHSLGNTGPYFLPTGIKRITFIHDVMFLKNSSDVPATTSAYQQFGRLYRRLVVPGVAAASDRLLTNSAYSKEDLIREIPGLRPENIHVTYLAPDPGGPTSESRESAPPVDSFILCLGAVDPRKNTERVVRCFLELKHKKLFDGALLIPGMRKLDNPRLCRMVDGSPDGPSVRFLGFISDEELHGLYAKARAFVYVSHYEGFGLPLVEAMSIGTPIISSRATSMPEIAGDAALLVDPSNDCQLVTAMTTLLTDPALAADLVKRGLKQAERFTWRRTAEQTLAVYESVAR